MPRTEGTEEHQGWLQGLEYSEAPYGLTYHHIIPRNALAAFWFDAEGMGNDREAKLLAETIHDQGRVRFARDAIAAHFDNGTVTVAGVQRAGDRNYYISLFGPQGPSFAALWQSLTSPDPVAVEADRRRDFARVYQWFGSNIHIGATHRKLARDTRKFYADDGGHGFEQAAYTLTRGAQPLMTLKDFVVLRTAYDAIVKLNILRDANAPSAAYRDAVGVVDLTLTPPEWRKVAIRCLSHAVRRRPEPYPFRLDNWEHVNDPEPVPVRQQAPQDAPGRPVVRSRLREQARQDDTTVSHEVRRHVERLAKHVIGKDTKNSPENVQLRERLEKRDDVTSYTKTLDELLDRLDLTQ